MATVAEKTAYRVSKAFNRHFERNKREVTIYGNSIKSDCTDCILAGPLEGSVGVCSTCGNNGYILSDSSACLEAIVSSAEPRKTITKGTLDHESPGSFHNEEYYVVFRLNDTITDPIAYPNRTIFELSGHPRIGWDNARYDVKSYARDGLGSEDFYLKVLVFRSE